MLGREPLRNDTMSSAIRPDLRRIGYDICADLLDKHHGDAIDIMLAIVDYMAAQLDHLDAQEGGD